MTVAVFAFSLAAYIAAGIWVSRRVHNSDDFFVMGESASTLLIVGTLAATYLSAVTLLGIAGISYSEGPLVIAATGSFGAWIGTMLAVLYVGRKLKSLGCRTMPDFFRDRFQSRWVTIFATVIMIVGLLGYGVIQLIGAGLILEEVIGISYELIIVAFVLALLVFSALGGMYGVVVTDTLMFFAMLAVSLLIAPLIIADAGIDNIKALSESMPGYWSIAGTNDRSLSFTFSQFLVWVIFFTCTPALVSRVFPARNDFVLLKAGLIGVFLASFLQLPVFLAAAGMQVLEPGIEPADRVMIVAFLDYLPPLLGGVGLTALLAAIMSTASTLFVLAGFGLSRDLYENFFRREMSDRHQMAVNRLAQLLIALIVATVAIARPSAIYWISIFAGAIFGVGWLPTVVAGLEWKRMNGRAALASMIFGVTAFILIGELTRRELLILPPFLDPLIVAFLVSVISLIVVALTTRPNAHEEAFFASMKATSASQKTIDAVLAQPNGRAVLKREVHNVRIVMVVCLFGSFVVWGSLLFLLAM